MLNAKTDIWNESGHWSSRSYFYSRWLDRKNGPQAAASLHQRASNDDHFPGTRAKVPAITRSGPAARTRPRSWAGESARTWLIEAAATGTARMNVKMAEAVTLAKIAGTDHVDRALGDAALHGWP